MGKVPRKVVKNNLRQKWIDLTPEGVSLSQMLHVFDRIDHAYGDPQRRFHTLLTHIRILLELQEEYFPDAPLDVILAIWFHDIFYLPGYKHNEAMSVELMRIFIFGIFPQEVIDDAAIHILKTNNHGVSDNRNTQIMCDLDLLGLASDPDDYDAGVRHIHFEYHQFGPVLWSAGRRAFIGGLLARPFIFQTEEIRTWFESVARSNLSRDLATHPPP